MLDSRQNVTGQLINKVDLKDAFEEAKHVVEVEVQKTILAVAGTSVSAASARASGSSASAALQAFAVLVAKTGASASGAHEPHVVAASDSASDAPSQQFTGPAALGTPAVVANTRTRPK